MSEPRLAAGIWVSALLRRVSAGGGFATVLARGDDVAGSVVIVHRDRNKVRAVQRLLGPGGRYEWTVVATGEAVESWIVRQRGYDPDLWIVELDTPNPARFIDETFPTG